jgi:hypothetical protein
MDSSNLWSGIDFDKISLVSTIVLVLLWSLVVIQNSSTLYGVTNPFTNSSAKIEKVSKNVTNANYKIDLKYSSQPIKKGEPEFFRVDMFTTANGQYTRMRHVDCDFIIARDKQELYKLSSQYGDTQYHSINGIMLTSFDFKELGMYTISVKITGEYFVPISPVFANFSGVITQTADGLLKINFPTSQ